jgi:hypothetical protein
MKLSVVVPLPDHRGHAIEAIRSWTQEQTCPRGDFEVVVIIDGREPAVEREVAALLAPHDQLVRAGQGTLHECYNAGYAAARGELLFFTESHVKAAPDCVERMLECFAAGGAECLAVASGGIDEDRFAGQEQTIYEEALPARIAGGWNLCTVRGFAVQRAAMDKAGGFAARYNHYCELLLGAALTHTGARMGYAPQARVWHFNSGTIAHFALELNAFGRDEIQFRAENPDSPLLQYLGPCPLWEQRRDLPRGAALRRTLAAAAGAIRHLARGRAKQAGRELEATIRFAPCAVLGPSWLQFKAAAAVQWAILWLYLGSFSDRLYYRAFRAMWNGQIRRGRIEATVSLLGRAAVGPAAAPQSRPEFV